MPQLTIPQENVFKEEMQGFYANINNWIVCLFVKWKIEHYMKGTSSVQLISAQKKNKKKHSEILFPCGADGKMMRLREDTL